MRSDAASTTPAAGKAHGPGRTGGTMRAVVQKGYGSADVLALAEVSVPEAGAGQVLVRVAAAGLDRGVWHAMTGLPYAGRLAFGVRRPKNPVLGCDVAGTVVALGPGVTGFAVGEEVYGFGKGTFAEYAVVRQDMLARKPSSLSFAQAAIVPVSGVTALQALVDVGRVEPGQRVLVVGASGGVGTYVVQLAKAIGAEVTGVCSTAKLDLVRSLEADHVLDYSSEDFADGAHRYDLVLDIAGNPSVSRLRRALTPAGTAVLVGGESGGSLTGGMDRQVRALAVSLFSRQRLAVVFGKVRTPALERLTAFLDAGTVAPALERTYPLERAPEAIRHLADGRVRGKVAITT